MSVARARKCTMKRNSLGQEAGIQWRKWQEANMANTACLSPPHPRTFVWAGPNPVGQHLIFSGSLVSPNFTAGLRASMEPLKPRLDNTLLAKPAHQSRISWLTAQKKSLHSHCTMSASGNECSIRNQSPGMHYGFVATLYDDFSCP